MPSASKRSLIRSRISRATLHCCCGAVLTHDADDDAVGVPALDAPDLGLLEDLGRYSGSSQTSCGDLVQELADAGRGPR